MAAGHTSPPQPVFDLRDVNGDLPLLSGSGRFRMYYDSGNRGVMCSVEGAAAKPLQTYDIAVNHNGKPTSGEIVLRYVASRPLFFPQNFTGSQLFAGAAATAQTVMNIAKNGGNVGTITIGIGGTTGVFASGASVSLAVGDVLTVIAQVGADATFGDFGLTLVATP